ncbi:MAG TPA: GNAT family N-acetyltransferase [Sphingomicrobium sp.]|nr:GNAT family N-acetyltransferase [Sphingomicrobium sp.]
MSNSAVAIPSERSALVRAIETDRIYFGQAAELLPLAGATLAWMPGLTGSAAAAVVQRVDPDAIADGGETWIAAAEAAITRTGARLARIYLDDRHAAADALLRRGGYAARDELAFVGKLPEPPVEMTLHPVTSKEDWQAKLRFHSAVNQTPDGHGNSAADWVELERRKCTAGMDAFLAKVDGTVVGAIGAVWGDGIVRAKNVVVHPAHRRRTIGKAMLCHIAALGRDRGISEQCVMAVRGETGELLYRAAGMQVVGFQVEWSKPLGGGQ